MQVSVNPGPADFWFVPLGGTGEIGMNLNLYGHNGHWLMIDCGISFFDQPDKHGFLQSTVIMPDISFVQRIKEKLVGLIVTHAHEDHLGAIPHLWPQIGCPIYTTGFTKEVLLGKLIKANCPAPVVEVTESDPLKLAPFELEPVTMTHSTPETFGFVINTPAARVFHTADWKLDPEPVIGAPATERRYTTLGKLDAVITDSTNALEPTPAISEAAVYEGLKAIIADAPGRVVVSCFASNIARLQTLGRIASETGRYLGLAGAALHTMANAAVKSRYLAQDFTAYDCQELGYLPPEEVLIIATGSQGQPGAALSRLALNNHPDLQLEPNDQVILSSKTIPGNEKSIEVMVQRLEDLGVKVWQAEQSNLPIHASGHGGAPELQKLFSWAKPNILVPVHGEPKHLKANAKLAQDAGVQQQLVGQNGDRFDLVNGLIERHWATTGVLTISPEGKLIPFTISA